VAIAAIYTAALREATLAELLREVQNEIAFYLQLFPLVNFVDTTRTLERIRNTDHASCSQVQISNSITIPSLTLH
jgi:hypothetical protein